METLHDLGWQQYKEEKGLEFGIGFSILPRLDVCAKALQESGGVIYVVDVDEKVVGFCLWQIQFGFLDYYQPVFHQIGLYILPEYRANGYGSALIDAGDRWADHKGLKLRSMGKAVIGTPEYMIESYKKRGYQLFQYLFFKNATIDQKKIGKHPDKEE